MEDLLPLYARIVGKITPSSIENFNKNFILQLASYFPELSEKTLNNHRTEMGTLFGLFCTDKDQVSGAEVLPIITEEQDFPAFFKDMCFKLQFPNGMDSIATVREKVGRGVKLRPCIFVMQVLSEAESKGLRLTLKEIAYFILNSLHALQGLASPNEVIEAVKNSRAKHKGKPDPLLMDGGSYDMQHIRELLGYMELANLIQIEGKDSVVVINKREQKAISHFISKDATALGFQIYKYDLDDTEETDRLYDDWSRYYGTVSFKERSEFSTPAEALLPEDQLDGDILSQLASANKLGEAGEGVVFRYEQNRIRTFDERLIDRVKRVGGTTGLGYDINSIAALGEFPKNFIYIEVKATTRVTPPEEIFRDSFSLTATEYDKAAQDKGAYFVYRVFFTRQGIYLVKLQDPVGANQNGTLRVEPTQYRVDVTLQPSAFERIDFKK